MSGYIDLQREAEEARDEREYRRRRWLAGIRGSLRRFASPRWSVVSALLISAVPGTAIGVAAYWLGASAWGPAEAIAVVAMWPIFIGVSWRMAERLLAGNDVLLNLEANIGYDMECEARENANAYGSQYGDIGLGIEGRCSEREESIWRGINSGMQQNGGGMTLIGLVLVVLVTVGTWLVWQLIRYGPTLFSELIFDEFLLRKMPGLSARASVQPALGNALAATGIHFVGFATVVLLLGGMLSCLGMVSIPHH